MSFHTSLYYLILLLLVSVQFAYSQNDCTDALVACGNTSYNNLSITGAGVNELSGINTCSGGENNTLWIKVNIKTPGTLGFTLTPERANLNIDFDFYVFGPDATCGNLGSSIRCSTTNPSDANSTSNITGMNGTETDTSEGPGPDGNNFVQWLDVLADETYYIVIDRFVGETNFSIEWTGTATFNQPPSFSNTTTGTTLNLESCDNGVLGDNKATFNLTANESLAIGTQANIIATFHTSENDAITGQGAIPNPNNYENTANPQTIYIRLENTITECFSTSEFTLKVTPFLTPDPVNIAECDLDNDGFVTFNLAANNTGLINGNSDIVVSYHPSANDAVVLPASYTNQAAFTNETIWAKIRNTVTGCYTYKPFDIIIKKIPNTTPVTLTQCDFELFPDGLTTFNLAEANAALTAGDANLSTQFFRNPTDAQNGSGALSNDFDNTSNPQVLTVKVTDNTTQCYSFTQLTLNVNTNPTITKTLEVCDDAIEDGVAVFNLADAGFETPGNTVTYYLASDDALLEQNQITTSQFSNRAIYARIENGNNCVGINIINLTVNPLPQFTLENKDILCLNRPTIPARVTTVIGNPSAYSFLWTPNGETTATIDAFAPGTYSVTVTDLASHCTKTLSTEVIASDIATILPATIIDLEDNNSITVNTSGIGDYQYSLDDANGPFQDSNVFSNVAAGIHIIYVRDTKGCGTSEKQVNVLGAPQFFTPNGDGIHDFWNIKGLNAASDAKTVIFIFNRYGKLLKQISPTGKGWDGTFGGTALPADDYWYTIQFENGRSAKGNFTLKR
ncbi:T9SS type B sorting domain-containing protein [Flavobacterium humi]|uniref:T9SS type B sorting domain-containing protein n=1 Tax=Flavobacterium humi TaxID=2562683 RepID=A0A4Z0L7V4_9FLAO|nr:T9SS type B sorting domain-containing protein [Flavobacterium humi]TGD58082.1 T9SS type B sorting domain-containing protein [Flavobacterium humi]